MPAQAQHGTDIWVGRTSEGDLTRGGLRLEATYIHLPAVNGILKGWADNFVGFDRVIVAEPENDLYPLERGTQIYLGTREIDEAFRIITPDFQIIDEPGESAFLGDENLHIHLTQHINREDPAFDPNQCVWEVEAELFDVGNTRYETSEPFDMLFTNIELRAADGDFDRDRDVDLDDQAAFNVCMNGPNQRPDPDDRRITRCEVDCVNAFDFDGDLDVDLRDWAEVQLRYTGEE